MQSGWLEELVTSAICVKIGRVTSSRARFKLSAANDYKFDLPSSSEKRLEAVQFCPDIIRLRY